LGRVVVASRRFEVGTLGVVGCVAPRRHSTASWATSYPSVASSLAWTREAHTQRRRRRRAGVRPDLIVSPLGSVSVWKELATTLSRARFVLEGALLAARVLEIIMSSLTI
jgi:hypothetical protein